MGDPRAQTALSEADYDAIAGAVMETARGRWFMAEYARRNRQADTLQLLDAIGRIERAVGQAAAKPSADIDIAEASALIADLRIDLERISGRHEARASGLAARIESAVGTITAAAETVQDAAWALRESGAEPSLCDRLDRSSAEISAASNAIDSTTQRIDKIADTIAMLDSSLRALDASFEAAPMLSAGVSSAVAMPEMPRVSALAGYAGVASDRAPIRETLDDVTQDQDIVFSEVRDTPRVVSHAQSESALRDIDAMPADRKLAYFA